MNQVGSRLQKLTGSLLSTVSIIELNLPGAFFLLVVQGIHEKVGNDFKALYGKLFEEEIKREEKK